VEEQLQLVLLFGTQQGEVEVPWHQTVVRLENQ
jgi:hypothetical protein